VLGGIADDRNRHAWHLALARLRRGEIAGQRWADIDLQRRTLRIGATRVDVGGRAFDQDEPKTANAGRVLPIPTRCLPSCPPRRTAKPPRSSPSARPTAIRALSSATRLASRTTRRR
jgi:integrase